MVKQLLFAIALLGGCWSDLNARQFSYADNDCKSEIRGTIHAMSRENNQFSSPHGKYLMISDDKSTITTVEFTDNQIIERSISENGDGEIKTFTYIDKKATIQEKTPFVVQLTEYTKFKQSPEGIVTKQKIKRKEVKALAKMNAWMILGYDENGYNCSVSDESGTSKSFTLKSVK